MIDENLGTDIRYRNLKICYVGYKGMNNPAPTFGTRDDLIT